MQAREELELSFVKDAEMVFTTLSTTGRRIFQAARIQFHTVLIDEAAQASELATLQAFAFGCKQYTPPAQTAHILPGADYTRAHGACDVVGVYSWDAWPSIPTSYHHTSYCLTWQGAQHAETCVLAQVG